MTHAAHRRLARFAVRAALPTLGTVWGAALVAVGLRLLFGLSADHDPTPVWVWSGVFLIAAGQFVFLVLVADRVWPPRHPALAHAVETLAAIVTLVAALAFVFALLRA